MEALIFSPFKVDYIVHPFGVWATKPGDLCSNEL